MALSDEWEEWLADWQIEMGGTTRSEGTVIVYLRGVRQFLDWLTAEHPGTLPGDVKRSHIMGWLGSLAKAGKSESTRRVRLMSLRVFFAWLAEEPVSGVVANPTDRIAAPMPELPRAQIPTDDDIHAVLATCSDRRDFADVRDAAILRLMLSTGLRRAELCSIDRARTDVRAGEIDVIGKGGRRRTLPLFGQAALAVSRYRRMRDRRELPDGEDALFVSMRTGRRLTGGAIAEMIDRRCVKAGVAPMHPHQLRHWWAHTAKSAGLSDEAISTVGGWSSPSMLARYGRELGDRRALAAIRGAGIGDGV